MMFGLIFRHKSNFFSPLLMSPPLNSPYLPYHHSSFLLLLSSRLLLFILLSSFPFLSSSLPASSTPFFSFILSSFFSLPLHSSVLLSSLLPLSSLTHSCLIQSLFSSLCSDNFLSCTARYKN